MYVHGITLINYSPAKLSEHQFEMVAKNSCPDDYDRKSEAEAFDNTKTGVKGLVDSGISRLPRIFKSDNPILRSSDPNPSSKAKIPIIDLQGMRSDPGSSKKVLEEIKYACEEWGFFQVVNHGIPLSLLDEMINGVRRFHEQDAEIKKPYYSHDESKQFRYYSSFDLYSGHVANWKDSISCVMAPDQVDPLDIPEICRDIILEYTKQVKELGIFLLELFSKVLGLKPDHLMRMDCAQGIYVQGHYYPACPEPELAIGARTHTDSGFFTILLQDNSGGLQVLHDDQWLDVDPIHGALVINIGDLLQLLTNDGFKSVIHRVLALGVGPRISMGCFFRTHVQTSENCRLYGPIKELLSDDNPPIYKQITITEYLTQFFGKGQVGSSGLLGLKL